jgi:hypothetical protein
MSVQDKIDPSFHPENQVVVLDSVSFRFSDACGRDCIHNCCLEYPGW